MISCAFVIVLTSEISVAKSQCWCFARFLGMRQHLVLSAINLTGCS